MSLSESRNGVIVLTMWNRMVSIGVSMLIELMDCMGSLAPNCIFAALAVD
jgi:hypothetical protein